MTNVGTRLIVKQQRRNKLTPTFSQYPYLVKNVKENMITAFNRNNGHTITRKNISFSEIMPVTEKAPKAKIEIEWDEEEHHQPQVLQPTINQRSREAQKKLNEKFMLNLYNAIQVNDKNTKKTLGNSKKK